MAKAGQTLNVVVCSPTAPGAGAGQLAGPFDLAMCPSGQSAFVVESYVPLSGSDSFFDGLMSPFDTSIASAIFGFAFGLVVFFYLLGWKGSLLLKPFGIGRY